MLLLNIGSVMNANFDQIFNLYSPTVYKTGDVLDTLVYRIGLVNANYSLSTAIGIFKSMVSMLLVGTSYYSAYKILRVTGFSKEEQPCLFQREKKYLI